MMMEKISRNIDTIYIMLNDGKYRCFTFLSERGENTYIVSEEELKLIYNFLKDDSRKSITIYGRDFRNDVELKAMYMLYKNSIMFVECVSLKEGLKYFQKIKYLRNNKKKVSR